MGGFYQDITYLHRDIHWACRRCVVRSMCTERCHRLSFRRWACEECKNDTSKCADQVCERVERLKLFERFNYYYGDRMRAEMIKDFEETSFVRLLKRPSLSPV